MLLGGEAFSAAPRVLELRLLVADRINQAKEDWKARRFPVVPGDEGGVHPAARSASGGHLSVTEQRRVALSTGIAMNVAGRAGGGPPAILVHGFPGSHRTWRAVAPLRRP
jgi:hypothetical protein